MKTRQQARQTHELLRYPNHPLAGVRPFCSCGGQVIAPAYPGDFFDCIECGKSWDPTKAQVAKMQRGAISR